MRLSAVAFLMILTTVFLSACEGTQMAALEDRGGNFYGRQGVVSLTADRAVMSAPLVPVVAQEAVASANGWQWPVEGAVVERFGQKSAAGTSEGVVIAAAEGTPIHAAQAGTVAFVGHDTPTYGHIVILRHADGDMTSYAHAQDILVKKGASVAAGQVIGRVGHSGSASSPQLHFAMREGGVSIDPLSKLPHQVASR